MGSEMSGASGASVGGKQLDWSPATAACMRVDGAEENGNTRKNPEFHP